MPKKGKKGKKGGKKRGKGSASKDADIKAMSMVNSNLWQARLEVVEQSRVEHREHARKLALENEELHTHVLQAEKDTVDVLSYLKEKDEEKDRQITKLKSDLQEQQKQHNREKEKLIEDFQTQVGELDSQLSQRTREVEMIRAELKLVKEFRRKRAQMQRELDDIKQAVLDTNETHKQTVMKMEQRFFDEKMRLQQEANRKILELADKAQSEAISKLDDSTKSVFKENVRLTQALSSHIEEAEQLRKQVTRLEQENEQLRSDRELGELLVQRKVAQSKRNKQTIKELREKVATLEQSLGHVVREFEAEQGALVAKTSDETVTSRMEIAKLQRVVELKTKEMNRVKKLARNILDQRTETERFFLDALDQVKKEVLAHRIQYRRDAEVAYQQRLLDACMGKADFPKVRTFSKTDTSTNSVFHDLQAATNGQALIGSRVDISELTWEQKEKVLRYLFARINRTVQPTTKHVAPPSDAREETTSPACLMNTQAWMESEPDVDNVAFLTQASVDTSGRLPSIQTAS
jgi:myosin heavy subunit